MALYVKNIDETITVDSGDEKTENKSNIAKAIVRRTQTNRAYAGMRSTDDKHALAVLEELGF